MEPPWWPRRRRNLAIRGRGLPGRRLLITNADRIPEHVAVYQRLFPILQRLLQALKESFDQSPRIYQ